MADKQAAAAQLVTAAITQSVPPGETLRGCIYANEKKRLYAVGVTDEHLIVQPLDRKMNTDGPAVVASPEEVEVGNVFSEGAMLSVGRKEWEMRFTAKGQSYKLMVLAGGMIENALAGSEQVAGLDPIVEFLIAARH